MSNPIWLENTQWRETGRQVKVGPLDGRLMIFVVLLMLFPSKILFAITISAILFFYGLEYIGYTLPNAYRKLSVIIAGKKRNGVHYWRQGKFK
jgi:hypothetical protein